GQWLPRTDRRGRAGRALRPRPATPRRTRDAPAAARRRAAGGAGRRPAALRRRGARGRPPADGDAGHRPHRRRPRLRLRPRLTVATTRSGDNAAMDDLDLDFARYDRIRPLRWTGDALEVLDQRLLPFEVAHRVERDADGVADAIRSLAVRGAPAIGIAAAWGVVLAARDVQAPDGATAAARLAPAFARLEAARPTAVNLAWALARMRRVVAGAGADWREVLE